MSAKKKVCLLLLFIVVANEFIVYATCADAHLPYWKVGWCSIDPTDRTTVSSGQTLPWQGNCTFDRYEWQELDQRYVIMESCNELNVSKVENRWTGSGTLSYSGSNEQKCDQTVPSLAVTDGTAGGSIVYKPRLRSDHDLEGRAGDYFMITIIGRDRELGLTTYENLSIEEMREQTPVRH